MEKLIKKVEKIFIKESNFDKVNGVGFYNSFYEKNSYANAFYRNLKGAFGSLKISLDCFWLRVKKDDNWGCQVYLDSIEEFGFDVFEKSIKLFSSIDKPLLPTVNNVIRKKFKSIALKKAFNEIVCFELKRAKKIHGNSFNSKHEAFAVMYEEVEEAEHEKFVVESALDSSWVYFLDEEFGKRDEQIEKAKNSLILLACETAQVVAMARKAQSVIEVEDD